MPDDITCWFFEGVSNPTPLAPSYLGADSLLFSSFPQFFVPCDLWPVDTHDGPQASVEKDCSFLEFSLVALHVSVPYRSTDFTLVLEITSDLHTGLRIAKAVLAFPILASMSRSDPPSLLMLLPRFEESSTSSIASPSSLMLSTFLVLTFITSGLDLLILRPIFADIFASRVTLACMPKWLWERRAMSLAKSRSSRRVVRVHCLPS